MARVISHEEARLVDGLIADILRVSAGAHSEWMKLAQLGFDLQKYGEIIQDSDAKNFITRMSVSILDVVGLVSPKQLEFYAKVSVWRDYCNHVLSM